jgi:hypothetical protein
VAGARGRTVLVIGEDPELAVALRDRLDRAYVTVCEVRPVEAEAAVRDCRPCPWMVVGAGMDVPGAVVTLLARQPTLLVWRGTQPPGLPAHARAVDRFSELAEAVEAAICAQVGGVRLAPGEGLTMTDTQHATSPALEALVASHPRAVFAPARHFRNVARTLKSHRVPLRLARSETGGARLVTEAG